MVNEDGHYRIVPTSKFCIAYWKCSTHNLSYTACNVEIVCQKIAQNSLYHEDGSMCEDGEAQESFVGYDINTINSIVADGDWAVERIGPRTGDGLW